MTMNVTRKTRVFGIVVLAVFTALVLLQKPIAGESSREADGARLLRGAIEMHFHVDATTPAGSGEQADRESKGRAYAWPAWTGAQEPFRAHRNPGLPAPEGG